MSRTGRNRRERDRRNKDRISQEQAIQEKHSRREKETEKRTGKGQKESDQSRSWMAVSDHCGDPVCIYCCFLFRSVQNEHRTGDEQYFVRRRCCSVK